MFLGSGEEGGDKDDIVDDGDDADEATSQESSDATGSTDSLSEQVGSDVSDVLETQYPLDGLKDAEVLVVDDDIFVGRAVERFLKRNFKEASFFRVFEESIQEAIWERVQKLPPGSFVVTDFNYGRGEEFTGATLARMIAAQRPDIFVIMLSGGGGSLLSPIEFKALIQELSSPQEGQISPVLAGYFEKPLDYNEFFQRAANIRGKWLEQNKTQAE